MLTPNDLITQQTEECPQDDQAPCDPFSHPFLKNPFLKSTGELGSPEHLLPAFLAWHPAVNVVLSFIITWHQ